MNPTVAQLELFLQSQPSAGGVSTIEYESARVTLAAQQLRCPTG